MYADFERQTYCFLIPVSVDIMGLTNGIRFLSGVGISIFSTDTTVDVATMQLSPLCWEVNLTMHLHPGFMVPYLIKHKNNFLEWQ
jgi:hypothetical protein